MTNDDVLFLAESLGFVDAPDMDPDFNYVVAENLREAEKLAKSINKAIEKTAGVKAYEEAVQKLREEYADKNKDGEPIIESVPVNGGVQQNYQIPGLANPKSPFNLEVEKLAKKHESDFNEMKEKMKFLEKENKQFKPLTVSRQLLPKGLSRRAMDAVCLFVDKPKK